MNTSEKQKDVNNFQNEQPLNSTLVSRLISIFYKQDKPGVIARMLISFKVYFSKFPFRKVKNKKSLKKWKNFKPYKINEFFFSKN